ncbi:MAG: hypothetical protein ACRD43_15305, partial [Pyrinomonadaceae bacterium]
LFNQCFLGVHGAYVYQVGGAWAEYNAEQQAQIVEDWYARGRSTNDREEPRFVYIRDHLRHPEKREGFGKQNLSGVLQ